MKLTKNQGKGWEGGRGGIKENLDAIPTIPNTRGEGGALEA